MIKNLDLLNHFVSPDTGYLLPTIKTSKINLNKALKIRILNSILKRKPIL
jgi:hypothetical protein